MCTNSSAPPHIENVNWSTNSQIPVWARSQIHRGSTCNPPRPKASITNVQTQQDTCRAPVSTHALMLHSCTLLHILNYNHYSKWICLFIPVQKHQSIIYPTKLIVELQRKYCVCRNWCIGLATITDSYQAPFMILVIDFIIMNRKRMIENHI